MAAMPLKQQVMDYVDQLDDERAEMVLVFTQTLAQSNPAFERRKKKAVLN